MDEEPKHTYTAREIVLEFFPATHERLIPKTTALTLERGGDHVLIRDAAARERLRLVPVETSGNLSSTLCCDFCQLTSTRRYLQILRAEVPGSNGRRFRYVTACRDTDACEARRLDDRPLEALLDQDG